MNDMLQTIEPKSDQLNADDLIGGRTLTITVTTVSILAGEQPVALHYEGDNGKSFKPCKSMRRVIVTCWGSDAALYAGRRMTLYRDDKVKFGSDAVGGIRISHMSDIPADITMPLTVSRGRRVPYTVRRLQSDMPRQAIAPPKDAAALVPEGYQAAEFGMDALRLFWSRLTLDQKRAAGGEARLAAWKVIAAQIDAETHLQIPAEDQAQSENRQVEDAGAAIPPGAPASDPNKPFALIAAATAAALDGPQAYKKWIDRLSAPDHERVLPYLEAVLIDAARRL